MNPTDFLPRSVVRSNHYAGLRAALDYVRDGEVLVVWKLDRLGRSTQGWAQARHHR